MAEEPARRSAVIRLAVSVEGQTEEVFVNESLAHHLRRRDVYPTPVLIGRARRRVRGGGDVTIDRLAREMRYLRRSFDAVTSLVDFYGFRGKGSKLPNDLVRAIRNRIREFDERSVLPYVQLHEFEGLLFSNVEAFGRIFPNAPVAGLKLIRSGFRTPEDINDHPDTAPSKRIETLIPRYRKTLHGPLLALEIGLDRIRSECPRFDVWLGRLEDLGSFNTNPAI